MNGKKLTKVGKAYAVLLSIVGALVLATIIITAIFAIRIAPSSSKVEEELRVGVIYQEDGGCYVVCGAENAENLTTVEISSEFNGKPVHEVGYDSFVGLEKLEKFILPETGIMLDHRAVQNCPALKEVVLPEKTTYGGVCFIQCGLQTVRIECATFAGIPFRECPVEKVILAKSVKKVEGRLDGIYDDTYRIIYEGTTAEWKAIEGNGEIRHRIYCKDGIVEADGTVK